MSKQTKLFQTNQPEILSSLDLVEAKKLANEIREIIDERLCTKLEVVGSIRRQRDLVHDIDFCLVASDSNWNKIISRFRKKDVICAGKQLLKLNYPKEGSFFQADFYRATEQTFGIQELIRTGSAEHNVWLAGYAINLNMRLRYSQGLVSNEKVIAGETEESVFTALGLLVPKPVEREIVNGKPVWLEK